MDPRRIDVVAPALPPADCFNAGQRGKHPESAAQFGEAARVELLHDEADQRAADIVGRVEEPQFCW
jgi:hypothetical protein